MPFYVLCFGGVVQVSSRVSIDDSELHFSFARSGGPGGQNVNKVNTKAVLRWSVYESTSLKAAVKTRFLKRYANRINEEGELVIASDQHRTQLKNKKECLDRLADMIRAVLVPPKKRKKTKPTRASKERRLSAKKQRSEKKRRRRPVARDD